VTNAVTSGQFDLRPPQDAPGSEGPPPAELFRIDAVRDGNRVVQLRGVGAGTGYTVEYRVDAVNGRQADGPPVQTASFATQADVKAFVDDVSAALQYLGCRISASHA
jgi:hypothetical protein